MKKEYDYKNHHIIEIDVKEAIENGLISYKEIEKSINIHCAKQCLKDNALMLIVVLWIFYMIPSMEVLIFKLLEIILAWLDAMLILKSIHKNLQVRNHILDKIRGEINND